MSANIVMDVFSSDAPQRVGVLAGVPKLLSEFGVPLELALEGLDVDRHLFENPDSRLPFSKAGMILDRCARLTDCDHFGLKLGAAFDHHRLGLPGAIMRNAPNLGAALAWFIRFQQINSRGAAVYLRRFDDAAILGYGIYDRAASGHEQILPLSMATALNSIQVLTGGAVKATEVHFAMRAPANVKPFAAFFRAPLLFNQVETGVVLPLSALDAAIAGAREDELDRLQKFVSVAMPPSKTPWSDRTRHAIKPLLLRGEPSSAAMAAHLKTSVRTLTRRLSEEGTGFQAILEEVRYTSARELLALTDLPIGDIAQALSYSAHAPFVDAFRRWAGVAPSIWRANLAARNGA